jgi:hypothetical protein
MVPDVFYTGMCAFWCAVLAAKGGFMHPAFCKIQSMSLIAGITANSVSRPSTAGACCVGEKAGILVVCAVSHPIPLFYISTSTLVPTSGSTQ